MNAPNLKSNTYLRLESALEEIESSPDAFDLIAHAQKYSRESAPMAGVEALLRKKIKEYDPQGGYGLNYLASHLERTSKALCESLKQSGNSIDVAETLGADFSFHDAGKVKQPFEFWPYTKDKPVIPDHIKIMRPQHTTFILDVLDETVRALGMEPSETEMQRLIRIAYFGKYHHENHLGSGPHKLPAQKIDAVLSKAITVDTADGKVKALTALEQETAEPHKIITRIFTDMASGKLKGHFAEAELSWHRTLYLSNPELLLAA